MLPGLVSGPRFGRPNPAAFSSQRPIYVPHQVNQPLASILFVIFSPLLLWCTSHIVTAVRAKRPNNTATARYLDYTTTTHHKRKDKNRKPRPPRQRMQLQASTLTSIFHSPRRVCPLRGPSGRKRCGAELSSKISRVASTSAAIRESWANHNDEHLQPPPKRNRFFFSFFLSSFVLFFFSPPQEIWLMPSLLLRCLSPGLKIKAKL